MDAGVRSSVTVDRDGAVAWVRYASDLDRLDALGLLALRRALDGLTADPTVRVIVFGGLPGRYPILMDPDEGRAIAALAPALPAWLTVGGVRVALALLRRFRGLRRLLDAPRWARRTALLNLVLATDALEAPGIVSVAAIDGPAFGGGMELALACDLRVASDRPDAWLAQPEVLGGVMAGFGATWRLPRLIGAARALELLVLGEAIDPHRAAAWGLVNRVLPAATFQDDVWALARRLATRPAGAVAGTKRALGRGPWRELAEVLTVWSSPDADRGLARAAVTIATEAARPTRRPLPELLAELERPPG